VGRVGPVGENVHRTADRARVARRWASPLNEGLGGTLPTDRHKPSAEMKWARGI
jgi:hypothetical protein